MVSVVFGQDFTYNFSLHNDGEIVPVWSGGLVSARLYGPTNYPTQNQIDRTDIGTPIEEVTTWVATSGVDNQYAISFSGIIDPDPHNSDEYELYFVVVNYYIQESNKQEVFTTETIRVLRPDGYLSRITVTTDDLVAVQNKLEDVLTTAQLSNHLAEGKSNVFKHLDKLNIKKRHIYDLSDLNNAVKFAAVASACFDLASEEEVVWLKKHEFYSEKWKDLLENHRLPLDLDKDNVQVLDEGTKPKSSIGNIYIGR